MAKLTAIQCRSRAACLVEAAEHLIVAWDEKKDESIEIDWAYKWLHRQVDYWEVKAEQLENRT